MLRIAVNNQSISWHDLHTLLSEANIKFPYNSNNIVIKSNNFPAELVNVDDNSIPEIVYKGIADIGFCMEHVLTNFGITKFAEYKKIGINKCNLSLIIPQSTNYKNIEWFNNKTIATPYPELLTTLLKKNNVKAHLLRLQKNIFKSVTLGLVDAAFDCIYTGTSLLNEQLKDVETLYTTETVMITGTTISPQNNILLEEFNTRINAHISARGKKMVSFSIPNSSLDNLTEILSRVGTVPKVISAIATDKAYLCAILDETILWDITEKLKILGVENIVVTPINYII